MLINTFAANHTRVERAAARLKPAEIEETGRFLGAGLGGGAYEVQVDGVSFVAKQWGHPESVMGSVSDTTPHQFTLFACKQAAVQNALAMAGFPVPASAILGEDARWVLMDKVEGLAGDDLSETERKEAFAKADSMAVEMEPIILKALDQLRTQHPAEEKIFTYCPDMQGNMRFARGPEGMSVAGSFDPVM